MFTQALENLAEPELKEKWMPKVKSYDIIGTYAQTELGHGTTELYLITLQRENLLPFT